MSEQPQVLKIGDCRRVGFCVSGVKQRCNELDLDFRRLVKEGLPISELEQIEDAYVQKSLTEARRRLETEEPTDG